MVFPTDFTWGAAAASYQIEGAACEDGKGLSVWDMMCRQPGKISNGETGEIACDHYHHMEEDVALMAEIGLQAYRLSISWPRVIPAGTGAVNPKGLDFYDRLVDELLAKNIKPWVTLFHWDYPYELFIRGGWLNPDSSDWYADYTKVVVDRLSDRISNWFTFNEPQCFIGLGHDTGKHAPGLKLGHAEVLLAFHNALLAHGKSVQVIRAEAATAPKVGSAPTGVTYIPDTNSEEDINAARKETFATKPGTSWTHSWWSDPVVLGEYPEDGIQAFGADVPEIADGDMETICQPLDFYGLNIYSGRRIRAGKDGTPELVLEPEGAPLTTMDWHVTPEALYWAPKFLHERYGLPVIVTENGMSNNDWVGVDGKVHDPQRIDFLTRYLREYHRAIEDGVPAKGYFLWSIMDNFEWAEGFKKRFGLIHVDYGTLKRTLKDSAYWYADVIKSNGANLLS